MRQIGGTKERIDNEGTVVKVTAKMLWYQMDDGHEYSCMKTNVCVLTETPSKSVPAGATSSSKARPKRLDLSEFELPRAASGPGDHAVQPRLTSTSGPTSADGLIQLREVPWDAAIVTVP